MGLQIVEKVKRALLAMRRHSWEQGVAAQAFLELGEREVVILMAKEAVLRQREDGTLYHITTQPQVWVDSMYMAPPFLAVPGHPEEAVRQIEGFRARLWHPEAHLYGHIWDEGEDTFVRAAHWGVGNGWAAAGIARVIRLVDNKTRQ